MSPSPGITPYNIGRNDLDPFGGVGIPRIAGQPQGLSSGQSGNLVGPDHPMFAPSNPYGPDSAFYDEYHPPGYTPPAGFPAGFTYPQPRFDPYGPPVGPNNDVDVGNIGGPLDPRFPGRGMPRGQPRGGRGNFPGEPNNDHFKPPGW
jgi:hypothetical protein